MPCAHVKDELYFHDYSSTDFFQLSIQIVNSIFDVLGLSLGPDNAGSVKRVGGYFKERLRELGGLDAVCELATSCFLNIRVLFSHIKHISYDRFHDYQLIFVSVHILEMGLLAVIHVLLAPS